MNAKFAVATIPRARAVTVCRTLVGIAYAQVTVNAVLIPAHVAPSTLAYSARRTVLRSLRALLMARATLVLALLASVTRYCMMCVFQMSLPEYTSVSIRRRDIGCTHRAG